MSNNAEPVEELFSASATVPVERGVVAIDHRRYPHVIRLTPVDRTHTHQLVPFGYVVWFSSVVPPQQAPTEDKFGISLLETIPTVDISTPVSEEYPEHCYYFLRRLHDLGRTETIRLWLQEGCDIVTYGRTQVLHIKWDDNPSVVPNRSC